MSKVTDLLAFMDLPVTAINWHKAAEAHYAILLGHPIAAVDLFTRDRVFWLMDERNGWRWRSVDVDIRQHTRPLRKKVDSGGVR